MTFLMAGTPASDWSQRGSYPGAGNRRGWSATRAPPRFSNAGLAMLLCIPLVLTGMTLGQCAPSSDFTSCYAACRLCHILRTQ
jgi:hypothetical protein